MTCILLNQCIIHMKDRHKHKGKVKVVLTLLVAPGSSHVPCLSLLWSHWCNWPSGSLLTLWVGEDGQSFDHYPQLPRSRDWLPRCVHGSLLHSSRRESFPKLRLTVPPEMKGCGIGCPVLRGFVLCMKGAGQESSFIFFFHSLPSPFRSERRRVQGNTFPWCYSKWERLGELGLSTRGLSPWIIERVPKKG